MFKVNNKDTKMRSTDNIYKGTIEKKRIGRVHPIKPRSSH